MKNEQLGFIQTIKKQRLTQLHLIAIVSAITIITIIASTASMNAEANRQKTEAAAVSDSKRITMSLHLPSVAQDSYLDEINNKKEAENNASKTHTVKVRSGDTLTGIFHKVGLSDQDIYKITRLGKDAKALTRIAPGQEFEITVSADKKLEKIVYTISKTRSLKIQNHKGKLTVMNESRDYETRVTYAKGVINSSLFETANDAGLSDNLTMDLAYIFGWDIDFALDIRQGDSFVVMYEELFLDGEKVEDGNILAAEFINQGKSFKALRYTDASGRSNYYSDDGRSMRKAFLRSPVDFSRISSRFGKRHHPILKKRRVHKGVDYAASRGTPVKASGDGKIIWRGRKGGYGKTVIVQHGSRYSTLYAHLNNYDRKARSGSRVKQGQVIGYVGSTGRATGPHLHYEFRVNGRHRNPLTIKLPNAAAINKKYRDDFESKAQPLLAQLNLIANTNVAMSDFQ